MINTRNTERRTPRMLQYRHAIIMFSVGQECVVLSGRAGCDMFVVIVQHASKEFTARHADSPNAVNIYSQVRQLKTESKTAVAELNPGCFTSLLSCSDERHRENQAPFVRRDSCM